MVDRLIFVVENLDEILRSIETIIQNAKDGLFRPYPDISRSTLSIEREIRYASISLLTSSHSLSLVQA